MYRAEFQTMKTGLIPKANAPGQLAGARRKKKQDGKGILNTLLKAGLSVASQKGAIDPKVASKLNNFADMYTGDSKQERMQAFSALRGGRSQRDPQGVFLEKTGKRKKKTHKGNKVATVKHSKKRTGWDTHEQQKAVNLDDVRGKLLDHVNLLHDVDKQHGTGFLGNALSSIGNVLGSIGKHIPMLKPFEGLLGENSLYGIAGRLANKVGIGKKRKIKGKGIISSIKNTARNIKDRVVQTITGRTRLPPKARNTLANHGTETISSMYICRAPVVSLVEKAMNLLSLGRLSAAKADLNYDKLFHLFMYVITDNGTSIILQKNEVIDISAKAKSADAQREDVKVDLGGKKITLSELVENTSKLMGPKFLKYSASENNCQNFVNSILTANQLNNSTLKNFVMQDTTTIFSKMPGYMKGITDKITGLAAKADVAINGAGKKKLKGSGSFGEAMLSSLWKSGKQALGPVVEDVLKGAINRAVSGKGKRKARKN